MSAFRLLARRAGAHSGVYVATGVATLLLGLASVAALTRLLSPAEFGRLAILLVASSILSMLFNLVTLQGTLSWAYGAVAGDDDEPATGDSTNALDPLRALATGVAMTIAVAGLGCLAVALLAPTLADWLLGRRSDASAVVWTAAAAAGNSLWRLVTNAVRVERRPGAYFVGSVALHASQLAGMVLALTFGGGVSDAVTGLAVGTFSGLVVAVVLARRSLRFAFSVSDARAIVRRGRTLVPVVLSFNVIQLGDVLVLSRFAPTSDVGLYRVASRIGASVSYWTSAFHMGWGPLRKDPLHAAAERELSLPGVAATMASYFVLSTTWALLALTLLANELVRIASPSYDDAAPLIPLTAAGFALHGLFVLVYRTQQFPTRRTWFVRLAVLAAISFIGLSLVLVPSFDAYGVTAAAICSWSLVTVLMWAVGHRSAVQVPYQYGRIGKGVAVAATLGAIALVCGTVAGPVEPLADLMAVALYPALLLRLEVLTVDELPLGSLRGPRASLPEGGADDELLRRLLVEGETPARVAGVMGLHEAEVRRRVVTTLRRKTGSSDSSDLDERIGEWLLGGYAFAERERVAEALLRDGVDPLDLHRLSLALTNERRAWRRRRLKPVDNSRGGG